MAPQCRARSRLSAASSSPTSRFVNSASLGSLFQHLANACVVFRAPLQCIERIVLAEQRTSTILDKFVFHTTRFAPLITGFALRVRGCPREKTCAFRFMQLF